MNELTPKEKLINLLNEKKVQFKEINKKWREDYDIDLIAVQLQSDNFSLISDNLKNNKEIALAAVKTHGATLSYLNDELRNDYDISCCNEKWILIYMHHIHFRKIKKLH